MKNNIITGSMTALITPFKNGKLDEVTYEKLIRRQIANGINAVVPVGTTGDPNARRAPRLYRNSRTNLSWHWRKSFSRSWK